MPPSDEYAPRTEDSGEAFRQSLHSSPIRYLVLTIIALCTLVNYADRSLISIAAPMISEDLQLNAYAMGIVFSAFAWTYMLFQIPSGLILDRFGNKLTYAGSLVSWALFTIGHSFATGLGSLAAMRAGLGVTEAPCYIANNRIVATWFPVRARARAIGVYIFGTYIGLALITPVFFAIAAAYGWRAMFWVGGLLALVLSVIWIFWYRETHETTSEKFSARVTLGLLRDVASRRKMLGICIGQFASNSAQVFLFTWFPTYLITERDVAWMEAGGFASIPLITAGIGVIFGGYISDTLLIRTGSLNLARKLPIVCGLLLASTIVAANYGGSDLAVLAIISLAYFGKGMASLGWVIVSDISPRKFLGLVGGIFNFSANVAGIVAPLLIGIIVGLTGSFSGALIYLGASMVVGALSYLFLLDDISKMEIAGHRE